MNNGSQTDVHEEDSLRMDCQEPSVGEEIARVSDNPQDFVFVEETGLYYSWKERVYYSPSTRLFYYIDLGAFYFFDEQTRSLQLHAPWLRMVAGSSVFVVTSHGASLGRGDLEVSLQDVMVSRVHCRISFTEGYRVEDAGSRHGTFLDGRKLVPGVSEPLSHGSILTVGTTQVLCHFHHMYEVCPECTPVVTDQKRDNGKEESYKRGISEVRKKFGLSKFVPIKLRAGYVDRARVRRQVKGSSCDHEKTESSSVHFPIRSDNRGYLLLKNMGWAEGEPLGKPTS